MINAFKANLVGGTVTLTPATGITGTLEVGETNSGTVSIPAGCLWVKIENAGLVVSGDSPGNITVNGSAFSVGRIEQFNSYFDNETNQFIALPSITIFSAGSRVRYSYFT